MKNKSDIGLALEPIVQDNKERLKLQLEYLQCDNAVENRKHLENLGLKFGFKMEYTAPNTPQQNGRVERAFAVTRDRALAMMIDARLTLGFQDIL